MATITYSIRQPAKGVVMVTWASMANGDTGQAFGPSGQFADKAAQSSGTYGVGGTIKLQGSNDVTSPTNWSNLNDPQGNSISLTSTTTTKQILENLLWVRPNVTSGDGTTSVTIILCLSTPTAYDLAVT